MPPRQAPRHALHCDSRPRRPRWRNAQVPHFPRCHALLSFLTSSLASPIDVYKPQTARQHVHGMLLNNVCDLLPQRGGHRHSEEVIASIIYCWSSGMHVYLSSSSISGGFLVNILQLLEWQVAALWPVVDTTTTASVDLVAVWSRLLVRQAHTSPKDCTCQLVTWFLTSATC